MADNMNPLAPPAWWRIWLRLSMMSNWTIRSPHKTRETVPALLISERAGAITEFHWALITVRASRRRPTRSVLGSHCYPLGALTTCPMVVTPPLNGFSPLRRRRRANFYHRHAALWRTLCAANRTCRSTRAERRIVGHSTVVVAICIADWRRRPMTMSSIQNGHEWLVAKPKINNLWRSRRMHVLKTSPVYHAPLTLRNKRLWENMIALVRFKSLLQPLCIIWKNPVWVILIFYIIHTLYIRFVYGFAG